MPLPRTLLTLKNAFNQVRAQEIADTEALQRATPEQLQAAIQYVQSGGPMPPFGEAAKRNAEGTLGQLLDMIPGAPVAKATVLPVAAAIKRLAPKKAGSSVPWEFLNWDKISPAMQKYNIPGDDMMGSLDFLQRVVDRLKGAADPREVETVAQEYLRALRAAPFPQRKRSVQAIHGTSKQGITEFRPGTYFAQGAPTDDDPFQIAASYAQDKSGFSKEKLLTHGRIYDVNLNLQDMARPRDVVAEFKRHPDFKKYAFDKVSSGETIPIWRDNPVWAMIDPEGWMYPHHMTTRVVSNLRNRGFKGVSLSDADAEQEIWGPTHVMFDPKNVTINREMPLNDPELAALVEEYL